MAHVILPSAVAREPETNLNLNLNTGPLLQNPGGRIPFIAVKGLLYALTNGTLKYIQKDGYIDIGDILTNSPVCNKLLYAIPDTDSDLSKSCLLSCFEVSCSQLVKQQMKLFNVYQQAIVKPATSKVPNVVKKSYTNIVIVHDFDYTDVQTTLSVSGVANKRLKEITKKALELSTVTGIDNLDDTELKKQSQRHLNDINQYLSSQLYLSQLSLNKGILNKCIQIAKGSCIARPLSRVVERYYETLWSKDVYNDDSKRQNISKILNVLADQANAAIYELEHNPLSFLDNLVHEFLDSRIITHSLTKGSVFKINEKEVGGIILLPSTSFSILNMYNKSKLKQGEMESVKDIYFKPDDIFAKQTDKDHVEILYSEGININKVSHNNIKTENLLVGNEHEKSQAVVQLTEAGKQLLSNSTPSVNNLFGDRKEYVMARVHFKKPVQYFEHAGKVYPFEIVKFNIPEDSETQWIMNSEINHMGVVVWGGVNKKSKMIESFATSMENDILAHDRTLQNPHGLFTTKSVTVKTPGLNSSIHTFDVNEALKALTNPTRFSCQQVLESINITAQRVTQLAGEHTKYLQSYFKEVNDTCQNFRKLYSLYMKSLTDSGVSIHSDIHNKLMRIEYKEFFTLNRNQNIHSDNRYTMAYRYLAGSIPWYVCGDEVSAIRGNKLLSSISNVNQWKEVMQKSILVKDFIRSKQHFTISQKCFDETETHPERLLAAGFNESINNDDIDPSLISDWIGDEDDNTLKSMWKDGANKYDDAELEEIKDTLQNLKDIANVFIDAFSALFQTVHEYELNYLYVKGNKTLTQWLFITHAILPVLTNGKMKLVTDGKFEKLIVNVDNDCPMENMILSERNPESFKTHILSSNVSHMATLSKYSVLHRIASLIMLFMYNTPNCIEQMACKGVHTGFSVAFVRHESTLAEDAAIIHPNSLELILGNGEIDNSEMASDGSTVVSLTCAMRYTANTIGPAGLLAQCIYPKPSLMDESTASDGTVRLSSDIITRTYNDKYHVMGDLYFSFNSKNKKILERNMNEIMDFDRLPYAHMSSSKREYVPIICPAVDLDEKKFKVLGLERCPDLSENGGKSAFHSFFFTQPASHSKNPYMSNLFAEGPVRYMKDTLMIDKNVPIKTSCFPKDLNTGVTTQVIEDMYNMLNEYSVSLTSQEQATFTNFEDQMTLRSHITQIPCKLPENKYVSYEHPDLRLGNATYYTQYTADDLIVNQMQQAKAHDGGDVKVDGTPFGFIKRSPFTANRDRNPRMIDY